MLTREQRSLLSNVLESLNRLFDRDCTPADIHALLVATMAALRGSEFADAFEDPIRRLSQIVQSKAFPDQKRNLGLDATDGLRSFIAEQLFSDKKENPKQRHTVLRGVTRYGEPIG